MIGHVLGNPAIPIGLIGAVALVAALIQPEELEALRHQNDLTHAALLVGPGQGIPVVNGEVMLPDSGSFPEWDELPLECLDWPFPIDGVYDWAKHGA